MDGVREAVPERGTAGPGLWNRRAGNRELLSRQCANPLDAALGITARCLPWAKGRSPWCWGSFPAGRHRDVGLEKPDPSRGRGPSAVTEKTDRILGFQKGNHGKGMPPVMVLE